MVKLVAVFAGPVAVANRFSLKEDDLWMGIIGAMACAAGIAAGFALAAFV
jgi:hypothetical protein